MAGSLAELQQLLGAAHRAGVSEPAGYRFIQPSGGNSLQELLTGDAAAAALLQQDLAAQFIRPATEADAAALYRLQAHALPGLQPSVLGPADMHHLLAAGSGLQHVVDVAGVVVGACLVQAMLPGAPALQLALAAVHPGLRHAADLASSLG